MKLPLFVAFAAMSLPAQCALSLLVQGTFEKFEPDNIPIPEISLTWQLDLDNNNTVETSDDTLVLCISNIGTDAVVTSIHVEDLVGILSNPQVISQPSVDYVHSGVGNLPGGNDPGINFIEAISFSPTPPPTGNGIGIGETAKFRFDWNEEVAALRLGIHVQSIGEQDLSASYLAQPTEGEIIIAPEPSGSLLISLAGVAFLFYRRK